MQRALILAVGLGAGVVLAAVLVVHSGVGAVHDAIAALAWTGFAVIVAFHLGLIALMGTSWWLLGRNQSGAGTARFVWCRLIRDSASEVLPLSQLGGFAAGARALALSGVAGKFSAASTVMDMLLELLSKLPYLLLGLTLLNVLRPQSQLAAPAAVGLLLLGVSAAVFMAIQLRGADLGDRIWRRVAQRWPGFAGEPGSIRQAVMDIHAGRGDVRLAFLGHLGSWVLGGIETWLTFQLMGVRIGLAPALAIDSLASTLRSAAFFVPVAAGVQETAYVLLSTLFGVPPAGGIALSLVKRGRDWAIGVPALLAWHLKEGRRARLAPSGRGPAA